MREEARRPGAQGDAEAPQPAGADADVASDDGGAGDRQQTARLARAHKRREGAGDAEAEAFNQRHGTEVAEFNQLTKDACLGEDGKLDPEAVKQWQREHDVAPDGKVGPKTLAAAGGKDAEPKDADKVDQPKTDKPDKPEKKQGAVDDILSWLDLATIQQAIQHLKTLALSQGAGKDQKSNTNPAPDGARPETSGLNSKMSVDAFGNAVTALQAQWNDMNPTSRGANLVGLANEQLVNAGVFPVDGFLDSSVKGKVAGSFHNATWKIRLNKELFSRTKFRAEDAPHMAATVYHEARHAEQYFRMAQMLAGRNEKATAEEVAAQIEIPPEVAAAAMQSKILPSDPAAAFGQKMFDDRQGQGAAHNRHTLEQVEREMAIYAPLRERYEAAMASKNPEEIEAAHAALLQVKQPVMHAWHEYVKLASEADAFSAEHAVDAKLGVAPE